MTWQAWTLYALGVLVVRDRAHHDGYRPVAVWLAGLCWPAFAAALIYVSLTKDHK